MAINVSRYTIDTGVAAANETDIECNGILLGVGVIAGRGTETVTVTSNGVVVDTGNISIGSAAAGIFQPRNAVDTPLFGTTTLTASGTGAGAVTLDLYWESGAL